MTINTDRGGQRMSGSELRDIRATLGFSSETLGNRLGVRADTVRRWESGRVPIPFRVPEDLVRVCEDQAEAIGLRAAELTVRWGLSRE